MCTYKGDQSWAAATRPYTYNISDILYVYI